MVLVALFLQLNSGFVTAPARAAEMAELQSQELESLSSRDPFPAGNIVLTDPLSKKAVDRVLVGPAFKAKKGAGFDYYRYVTFYDIERKQERVSSLPVHRQQCFDKSDFFASYSYTYTFTAAVTASISFEGLGLSSTMTQSKTLTTGRNVRATGTMVADHTPYMIKQNWYGRTFIQTYTAATGKVALITKETKASNPWFSFFFPAMTQSQYPMNFEVKDAEWTFAVERTMIEKCPNSPEN